MPRDEAAEEHEHCGDERGRSAQHPYYPCLAIITNCGSMETTIESASTGAACSRIGGAAGPGSVVVRVVTLAAAMALISMSALRAHHSFPSYYFEEQMVTVMGELIEFDYRAPHAW